MIAAAVALAVLAAGTSTTRSDWTAGAVTGAGSARTGALSFGHTYQDTSCNQGERTAEDRACPGSIAPTVATTSSGVTATDTITNAGTVEATQLHAEVRAASCAPVQLANRAVPDNPLLPRHHVTFHAAGGDGPMGGSGYVHLDGADPGGYATSVVAESQPTGGLVSLGNVSGLGVWFRAAAGATGPLFSFSESPASGAGSADRTLYLDAEGRLDFVYNLYGARTGTSTAAYADGQWHFAYVTISKVGLLLSLDLQVTLWVDGTEQATHRTGLLSTSLSSYDGYWHLGWAPPTVTGLGVAYLDADLSNFVVLGSSAPDGDALEPTTQAAFDTATSDSTHHWVLDDTGTTTFAGALPTNMRMPCEKIAVTWVLDGPAATVAATTPLAALADDTWRTVAAPPPGSTQTSTITTTRGSGWHSDLAGLRLHAPLSYRVRTTPAGAWSQTFTWSGAEAAFLA